MTLPDEILDVIKTKWYPGQETFIKLENTSPFLQPMITYFEEYDKTNNPEMKLNIGPFVGITPHGFFADQDKPEERTEFMFLYDELDRSKLEQHHLGF